MSISELASAGLEEALNQYIALDPKARDQLAHLHGRAIGIDILGTNLHLYLVPGPAHLQVFTRYEGEPDCTLRGSPWALARLGLDSTGEKGAEQLLGGRVEITGDSELGHRFGEILGDLNIDWEAHLSRFTGDAIAHDLGNGMRSATRWGRHTLDALGQDIKEYLQEQGRLLPSRPEIQRFLKEVDALRDDTERLAARIERLRCQPAETKGASQ